MPKRRMVQRVNEMMRRTVEITSMKARVSIHGMSKRGFPPAIETSPWLELHGLMKEPVKDVSAVKISIYPTDRTEPGTARPVCVGAIIRSRPQVDIVIPFPQADFDRVWPLALHGHLKHAHLVFTRPSRNGGLVVDAMFSTHPEEE
jgi:hypothetical protein